MYANAVAFAYTLEPTNLQNMRRTLYATLGFATGAIVGWPFAAAVAIPFVFEELHLYGTDALPPKDRMSWRFARWRRFIVCTLVAGLIAVRGSWYCCRHQADQYMSSSLWLPLTPFSTANSQ